MELKVEVGYEQLVLAIKQLSVAKIMQLKAELAIEGPTEKPSVNAVDFQKLLLSGPVMDDKQYENYKNTRNRFKAYKTPH